MLIRARNAVWMSKLAIGIRWFRGLNATQASWDCIFFWKAVSLITLWLRSHQKLWNIQLRNEKHVQYITMWAPGYFEVCMVRFVVAYSPEFERMIMLAKSVGDSFKNAASCWGLHCMLSSFVIILQTCYKKIASIGPKHRMTLHAIIFCNHLTNLLQKIASIGPTRHMALPTIGPRFFKNARVAYVCTSFEHRVSIQMKRNDLIVHS